VPDVQLDVLEPRVFAALQPQVDEPEDPEPGEQLLVGNVQAVPAQHRRWVPLAVGVQHLGLSKLRLYRRSCPGGRIGRGQGWLLGADRRRRVAHPLRLERISASWQWTRLRSRHWTSNFEADVSAFMTTAAKLLA